MISAMYSLNMSPGLCTTNAIRITATHTRSIVIKIDAYFMKFYIRHYSFRTIISKITQSVHVFSSNV